MNTCLYSANCLRGGDAGLIHRLTSAQKKSADVLRQELELLSQSVGIQRMLFLTFTFPNPVPCLKARENACLKIRKNLLQKIFQYGVTVSDRSETGRPHYHIVVIGRGDVDFRINYDFQAWHKGCIAEKKWNASAGLDMAALQQWQKYKNQCANSASQDLRDVWKMLLDKCPEYGFGRINALPIEHPIGYARYLAKCVTNGFREKHHEDKKIRRVRFWGGFPRRVSRQFHRLTRGSRRWSGKMAFCAHMLGFKDYDDFAKHFGPRWFFHLKKIIDLVPIPVADVSLYSPNLPLHLFEKYSREISIIETELVDRLERYGRLPEQPE